MDDKRFLQALFALSVALVLLLSMLPAVAQAPDNILIKPVAVCVDGKCTLSEQDLKTLQLFHMQRMVALQQAQNIIDEQQAQIEVLMRKFARFAMGCEKVGT